MKLHLLPILCVWAISTAAHAQNIAFMHDGLERQYRIYIPDELPESPSLVLALHGYSGNNNDMMNNYGWTELADERGFVVAFPNGTRDQSNNRFWDVDYEFHEGIEIDDDGFLRELALYLQDLHSLDPNKTFVTGFSNGAEMCFQLACRESETFMAFAPIVGMMMDTLFTNCNPTVPRPILSLNGTADDVTLYQGDMGNTGGWGAYRSIPEMMAFWANILGTTEIDSTNLPDVNPNDGSTVRLDVYSSPNHDLEMWYYLVIGGGHDWPGQSGNMDIDAAVETWNFFERLSAVPCVGDLNDSGDVSVDDLLILLSQYSTCTGDCSGDLDGNGDVGVDDLLILIQFFGMACESNGACCLPDGTCQYLATLACADAGGEWNGALSSCTTTSCSSADYDECSDAMTVTNGFINFSTTDATSSSDLYDDSLCLNTYLGIMYADIWFAYESTCNGTLTISTCDSSDFDTELVLYAGDCANKVQVACNGDDDNCSDYTSYLEFPVIAGENYLIRLGGWESGNAGNGILRITCE
jgi:polyhydroxybutyrate depolymerase